MGFIPLSTSAACHGQGIGSGTPGFCPCECGYDLNHLENFRPTKSPLRKCHATLSGTGTTLISSNANLNIDGTGAFTVSISGHALQVYGKMTASAFNEASGASVVIEPGGEFDILSATSFNTSGGATLTNMGKMLMNSTGSTSFAIPLINSGTVEVAAGELSLDATVTTDGIAGAFIADSGATLRFQNTSFLSSTLGAGSSVSGLGTIDFDTGFTSVTINGSYNVGATILEHGGHAIFNTSDFSAGAALTGDMTASGTLDGSGTFTVTGNLHWNGGTMQGTSANSATIIQHGATLAIDPTGVPVLSIIGRALNIAGTATWTGAQINASGNATAGALIYIQPGGTLSTVGSTGSRLIASDQGDTPARPLLRNGGKLILSQGSALHLDLQNNFNYQQDAMGELDVELGGTTAWSGGTGGQFDFLSIGGNAMLDGTLKVSLLPPFTPASTDMFKIVTFGSNTNNTKFAKVDNTASNTTLRTNYTFGANGNVTLANNHAPVAANGTASVNEDATFSGNLPVASDGDGDPLTYSIVNGGAYGTATVSTTGAYTYTPNPGVPIWVSPTAPNTATDTFTYKANDTFNDSNIATITVTINFVNDPPSFTKGADQTAAANSGLQMVPGWATNISAGPPNETTLSAAPQTVSFNIVTNDNSGLFSFGPVIDGVTGTLMYTPTNNVTGTANITIEAMDDSGLPNNTSAPQPFSITVTTPPPPFAQVGSTTTNEETPVSGNLNATFAPNTTLTYAIVSNSPGTTVSVDSMTGVFSYSPATGVPQWISPTAPNTATDTFTFDVFDGFSYSNVGTITVTINFVNDPPSFTAGASQSVTANSGLQTVQGWATNISAGPANESAQTVAFNIVTNDNPGLFSFGPVIDGVTGTLMYTPTNNVTGTANITIEAQDDSGLPNNTSAPQPFSITVTTPPPPFANGGAISTNEETLVSGNLSASQAPNTTLTYSIVSSSPGTTVTVDPNSGVFSYLPATGVPQWISPTAPNTATDTFTFDVFDGFSYSNVGTITVTINFVNDPPSFTAGANQTVAANAGAQSVAWATNISAGPANESAQTVSFIVTPLGNASTLVSAQIDPSGNLTYTPVAGAIGTAMFSVVAQDNSGLANNTSGAQPLTITITPAVATTAPAVVSQAYTTNENAVLSVAAPGVLANDTPNGNASITAVLVAPPASGGVVLNSDGSFAYRPNQYFNGTDTFTYLAHGDTLDSNTATVTITVNFVNQVPYFTKGSDLVVLATDGAQSFSGWATGISAGAPNETSQSLTFLVSNNANTLFSVQPEISANGTLAFTTAGNTTGDATVTVQLMDDGGTANGGIDTSAAQTFVIHVVQPFISSIPIVPPVEATSPSGTPVSFTMPDAHDMFNLAVTLPLSVEPAGQIVGGIYTGSFKVGLSTVTFTTMEDGKIYTASLTITVTDTTPPVFGAIVPITVPPDSATGAVVTFNLPTATDNSTPPNQIIITASPVSGSLFPIGTTNVIFTAVDLLGNTATATTTVTVQPFFIKVNQPPGSPDPTRWPAGTPGQFSAGVFTVGPDGIPNTDDDIEIPALSAQIIWNVNADPLAPIGTLIDDNGGVIVTATGSSATFGATTDDFITDRVGSIQAAFGGLTVYTNITVRALILLAPRDGTFEPFGLPTGIPDPTLAGGDGVDAGGIDVANSFVWSFQAQDVSPLPASLEIDLTVVTKAAGYQNSQTLHPVPATTITNGQGITLANFTIISNNGILNLGKDAANQPAINIFAWDGYLDATTKSVPNDGSVVTLTIRAKSKNGQYVAYSGNRTVSIQQTLTLLPINAVATNGQINWNFASPQPLIIQATSANAKGGIFKNAPNGSFNMYALQDLGNNQFGPRTPLAFDPNSRSPADGDYYSSFQSSLKNFPVEGRYLIFAQAPLATTPKTIAQSETLAAKALVVNVTKTASIIISDLGKNQNPAIALDVLDGGQFTNTLQLIGAGPGATNFVWSADPQDLFPQGAINESLNPNFAPKVEYSFTDGTHTSVKITNNLYWYAPALPAPPLPNDLSVSNIATYRIVCRWTDPKNPSPTAGIEIQVVVPPIGGSTAPILSLNGAIPVTPANLQKVNGQWKLVSLPAGAITRTLPPPEINVPSASQFVEKITKHEDVHKIQFSTGPNDATILPENRPNFMSEWFSVARATDYIIRSLNGTLVAGSAQHAATQFNTYVTTEFANFAQGDQQLDKQGNPIPDGKGGFKKQIPGVEFGDYTTRILSVPIMNAVVERPAYDVSDKIPPQFIYIGNLTLGPGNNGPTAVQVTNEMLVQPKLVDDLLKITPPLKLK